MHLFIKIYTLCYYAKFLIKYQQKNAMSNSENDNYTIHNLCPQLLNLLRKFKKMQFLSLKSHKKR